MFLFSVLYDRLLRPCENLVTIKFFQHATLFGHYPFRVSKIGSVQTLLFPCLSRLGVQGTPPMQPETDSRRERIIITKRVTFL